MRGVSCFSSLAIREDQRVRREDKQSAVVQGTLHMLILKILALEPMHGYGVAFDQVAARALFVVEGSQRTHPHGPACRQPD